MKSEKIYLLCIEGESNKLRQYSVATAAQGNELSLQITWGRVGLGSRWKDHHFESEEDLIRTLKQILQRRRRHGYERVGDSVEDSRIGKLLAGFKRYEGSVWCQGELF